MIESLQLLFTLGLALLMLVSTGSFLFHFFVTRNNPNLPQSSGESYLKAFLSEGVLTLIHGMLWPLGWFPIPSQSRFVEAGGPPIVLLPGILGTRGNLMPLYWRLEKAGYQNIYLHNLSPFNGSLEKQAHVLHQHLDTICRLSNGKPLCIIGFGSSGLVLRTLLDRFPNLPVERFIALGCAHHGTQLGVLNPGRQSHLHHHKSDFLTNLRPLEIPVTSIVSTLDQFIIPPLQRLDDSGETEKWIQLENIGHFQLLYSKSVIESITAQLSSASSPLSSPAVKSPQSSGKPESNES